MPLRRSDNVMLGVGGRLYVIGGVGEQPRVTLEYMPATDSWSRRAPMPSEREHLSAAEANGRIRVIGGRWVNRGNVNTVEEYDPASDAWRAVAPLPTARHDLASAGLNGRLYVIAGGRTAGLSISDLTEIFVPE